jgi:trehalose 6-phosphate synthase/phosphatase
MDRALETALEMPEAERITRMFALRERVLAHDVHQWSHRFLRDAERVGAARGRAGLAAR